jgi:hypothetical protein
VDPLEPFQPATAAVAEAAPVEDQFRPANDDTISGDPCSEFAADAGTPPSSTSDTDCKDAANLSASAAIDRFIDRFMGLGGPVGATCYPRSIDKKAPNGQCASGDITEELTKGALSNVREKLEKLKGDGSLNIEETIWKAIVMAGYIESPDFTQSFGRGCRDEFRNKNPFWLKVGAHVADNLALSSETNAPFPGKCAFWSGGIDVSKYARACGYTTLENSLSGNAFDEMNPFWGSCDSNTRIAWERIGPIWNTLSKDYAARCKGEVTVFMRAIDETSVLFKQEFPQLKRMTAEVTNKPSVTLTYKFLLGNSDKQIEEADGVRAMMLLSGSVQLADITTIRANSYMFKRISKCKEESLSCDGKNEEVWPDIKVVFKLLWRHYLRTKYFCDLRFKANVGGEGKAVAVARTDQTLEDQQGITDWESWMAAETNAQTKRGPPFWSIIPSTRNSASIPEWGFSIDRMTRLKENFRVHAEDSDSKGKYTKWSEFCRGFLNDKFGFEKNVMATAVGGDVIATMKARAQRARDNRKAAPSSSAAYTASQGGLGANFEGANGLGGGSMGGSSSLLLGADTTPYGRAPRWEVGEADEAVGLDRDPYPAVDQAAQSAPLEVKSREY